MVYIKKFETHSDYETYIEGEALLPNVSKCADDGPNEVHYNSIKVQPNNEIWYTTTTNETIDPSDFYVGVAVVSNEYDGKMCVIRFEEDIIDITALFYNDGREEDETQLLTVQIPETVEIIGDYTFYDCSSLTSITIPNSVTNIGNCAFQNCNDLTSVTIPSGVTSIGDEAFAGCNDLTAVTIHNSVTSIGEGAFYDCANLTTMTIEATMPPTLGAHAISDATTTIYVPSESVNAYKKASNWSAFASKIQPIQ